MYIVCVKAKGMAYNTKIALGTQSAQMRETYAVSGLQAHANRTAILRPKDQYGQMSVRHCTDQVI